MRGIPDVAAVGDPVTGIAVVTGDAGRGYTISAHECERAPVGRDHRPRRPVREAPPGLRGPGQRAGQGWDPVTGWGSPDAQFLLPLLARYA
jgi:hypothetical protein